MQKEHLLPQLNHVGITVDSIEDTIDFYRRITTVEVVAGPTRIAEEAVGDVIRVKRPNFRSCVVRIGTRGFELVQHDTSKGDRIMGRHNNVGGVHLAFMVENIESVMQSVKDLGITTTASEPYSSATLNGYKTFFFEDVNGYMVEIGQMPPSA